LTIVPLQKFGEVRLNNGVGLDEQQAAGVQKITTLFNLAEVQHNMAVAPLSTGRGEGRERGFPWRP
jgi:ribosomal protein L16/L10AE